MKVFLIDDDELQTQILTEIIHSNTTNINVESSVDTSNLVDSISKFYPDIIVLDLYMPNSNGLTVCSDLKSNHITKNIPIVILSGSDDSEDKKNCYKAGCIDYLTKPVTADVLLQKIKKYGSIGSIYKSMGNMAKAG